MKHNYEIICVVKENLDKVSQCFIYNIIDELKKKHGLDQYDNIIYRNEKHVPFDDIPHCESFVLEISNYREYFQTLTYNNLVEGIKDEKI
ncbi:UNVERIFIED_CONTAM: hypothetical protein KB570_09915 [Streptococcus canis]|uniref:hypothetical protein n=1 Tax=Streptococcus canis TaxID=1329 RepID=UPI002AA103E4|nr:hypothetical protein SpKU43_16900 [Streptococcus canis]